MSNPTQTQTQQTKTPETIRLRALRAAEHRLAELEQAREWGDEMLREAVHHREVDEAMSYRREVFRDWDEARREVARLRRG